MKAQNPWQKLLQEHIKDKFAPPPPPGYHTREEVSKLWQKSMNTTSRMLSQMLLEKKVDMKRHPFIIPRKDHRVVRNLKIYKILSTKPPRK
jgi:hypothetical protein